MTTATIETVIPGLHASAPLDLGFGRVPLQARAFLLEREAGNLLLYGASAIEPQRDEVRALGGIVRQYLNHSHEATTAADRIGQAFDAPLVVHAADAAEVAATARVGATFDHRHRIGDDLEAIPIPGHTAGATAYLWRAGDGERVLFTGDSVFVRGGRWVAALLDGISDRGDYLSSLELLRGLTFDRLVPGVAPVGQPFTFAVDRAEADRQLGEIVDRLWAGQDQ
ncbi:MBL fold metallo-hydrolase [Patulibacter defluvii]|uniref:MBL fold metallo-hydrolase n=1 Tax=Patulibacter defluvii TaxID=3095358 RepID=UPI002A752AE0|nr:MBL fold metallo-hydrolase [Patulibacter sp. DM4]